MANLLEKLFSYRAGKEREVQAANVKSWRRVLWQSALEATGAKIPDPIDVETAHELMEKAPTTLDAAATVALIGRRIAWAKDAANLEQKRLASDAAAKALSDVHEREAEHARRVKEEITALQMAHHAAQQIYLKAAQAEIELQASAEPHPDAVEVELQLVEVHRAIGVCKARLDHLGAPSQSCVAAARLARATLDNPKLKPAELTAAKSRLATAEGGVEAAKADLVRLAKEEQKLHAKLAKLAHEQTKPEHFRIVRTAKRGLVTA